MLVLISVLTEPLAYGAQWRQRPACTDWPQAALAAQAYGTWDTPEHLPLMWWPEIIGDRLVTTARVPGCSVLINHDPRFSPWVSAERLQKWCAVAVARRRTPHPTGPHMEALPPPETVAPSGTAASGPLAWPFNNAPMVLHWRV